MSILYSVTEMQCEQVIKCGSIAKSKKYEIELARSVQKL